MQDTVASTQPVDEQADRINQLYGQNCGGYSLRLEPALPFLTMPSDELISLNPTTNDHVGVYPVKLIVENPVGYSLPDPGGNLDPIEYDFTATVHPCPLTDFILTDGLDQEITYAIGDPSVSS